MRDRFVIPMIVFVLSLSVAARAGPVRADGKSPAATPDDASAIERALSTWKDNPLGSFGLSIRPRYEYANQDGRKHSNAFTTRVALGFGTRAYRGLSAFAEGEGIFSPKESRYFDGVVRRSDPPSRRTLVPDPQDVGLNQLYVDYRSTFGKSGLRVGRQRMALDDQRFIGNIAWRQNEMTMDAVRAVSSLGVSDLRVLYAFVHKARRPFGNRGGDATRDFESESHLIHVSYAASPLAEIKLFAYLLDFDNAPASSSQTYGARLEGGRPLTDVVEIRYVLSYAHQWDAAGNPQHYDASYQLVRATVGHERAGSISLAFERLGSDAGRAVFSTPLSTAHVWNGFADAFLDNGGPEGLRALSLEIAPRLPWRLTGSTTVHWFRSDQEDRQLGWEIDAILSRPVTRWATVLLKAAYFDGRARFRPTRVRAWVQLTLFF